jgi:hypothetical protein
MIDATAVILLITLLHSYMLWVALYTRKSLSGTYIVYCLQSTSPRCLLCQSIVVPSNFFRLSVKLFLHLCVVCAADDMYRLLYQKTAADARTHDEAHLIHFAKHINTGKIHECVCFGVTATITCS